MDTKDEPIKEQPESAIAQTSQEKAQHAKDSELTEKAPAKETARFIPSRARKAAFRQADNDSHPGT